MTKTRFFSIAGGKVKRIRNRFGDTGHHYTFNLDTNTKRTKLESERSSLNGFSSDLNHTLADIGSLNRIDIFIAKPDGSYKFLKGTFFRNELGQSSFIMA